ncbi:WD domain-containing protein [Colletotrichum truncatum]|uniref:WD domain-containing protein n=1 Tax=Colletotrichum truncatum TaxID=5467 RepID=A0ACC3Z9D6_COLTU
MGRYRRFRFTSRATDSCLNPRDSGYQSNDTSEDFPWDIETETPPRRKRHLEPSDYHLYLDGSGAEDNRDSDDEEKTLPPLPSKSRPEVNSSPRDLPNPSLVTPIKRGRDSASSPQYVTGSVRTADRYVPHRDPETPPSERLRVTKEVEALSPTERLLRHQSAAPDPFQRPQQQAISLASSFRSISGASFGLPSVLSVNPRNQNQRPASSGVIWTVGGLAPPSPGTAVDDGRGHYLRSGSNARMITTNFATARIKKKEDLERYEGILAAALQINQASRVLDFTHITSPSWKREQKSQASPLESKTYWNGTKWVSPEKASVSRPVECNLPTTAYRVLDAPGLQDDYYNSILAFSPTCDALAVGLASSVYIWSEKLGASLFEYAPHKGCVTSLSFSSTPGGKVILAVGRSGGHLYLRSLFETLPRHQARQATSVTCVC